MNPDKQFWETLKSYVKNVGIKDGLEEDGRVILKMCEEQLKENNEKCPFCSSEDVFSFELKHSKCRKCNEQWTN
jgi:ribosomal protein L37AE/L43A